MWAFDSSRLAAGFKTLINMLQSVGSEQHVDDRLLA